MIDSGGAVHNAGLIARRTLLAAAAVGLIGALGCTDQVVEYVNNKCASLSASSDTGCVNVFNPPPDTANGFLGLYDVANNITTCGNCHVEKQAEWSHTKHASAWPDLQASGHASEACEPCHTTNELGNIVTVPAGFNVVPDSAYFNVQCESCHGPGLRHLQNGPEVWQPLASIAMPTSVDSATNGCAECHQGDHNPYADEWILSKHGYGGNAYIAEGSRDPCRNCHEGKAALGVTFAGLDPRPSGQPMEKGVYLEASDSADFQPITCAVCHDPHDVTYEGQLRAQNDEPELSQLCVHCHRREGAPENGSAPRRGPHGAQGLVVIDEDVGWKPPTWPYTSPVIGSHAAANPRQCAACHITPFSTDVSGTTMYYTGHLFEAIPCLDPATGLPTTDGTCSEDQRYFGGCAVSGCHGSAGAARTALDVVKLRMDVLTDALWSDDNHNGVMETTDGGVLPQVLAKVIAANNLDEMNLYDTTLTPAEGAIWNAQLAATSDRPYWLNFKISGQHSCADPGCTSTGGSNTGHMSSGEGAHNPFLLEALLLQSIDYLQSYYGVQAPAIDLSPELQAPPGMQVASRGSGK